jgi:hypothetical protein
MEEGMMKDEFTGVEYTLRQIMHKSVTGGSLSDSDVALVSKWQKSHPVQYSTLHKEVKSEAMRQVNPFR